MAGHWLKGMYPENLEDDHPCHLITLIERLDAAERVEMRARQR